MNSATSNARVRSGRVYAMTSIGVALLLAVCYQFVLLRLPYFEYEVLLLSIAAGWGVTCWLLIRQIDPLEKIATPEGTNRSGWWPVLRSVIVYYSITFMIWRTMFALANTLVPGLSVALVIDIDARLLLLSAIGFGEVVVFMILSLSDPLWLGRRQP